MKSLFLFKKLLMQNKPKEEPFFKTTWNGRLICTDVEKLIKTSAPIIRQIHNKIQAEMAKDKTG